MKLRWKLSIGITVLVVAPLLLVLVMHFKVKNNVATYKKQLLAKGEKLAIADWIPKSATNTEVGKELLASAEAFIGMNRDRHPSIMRMVTPGRAQVSWQNDEIYDWEFKKRTNVWNLIRNDFDDNPDSFEQMREATANGEIVFPIAYEQGFRALLPHLVKIKVLAVWLSTATVFELHENKSEEAAENLLALLQFLKNYEPEPLLIGHLVRFACANIAFNTTWEALQYDGWTDSELQQFQKAWSEIQIPNLETTFAMERAMGIQMLAEARITGENPLQANAIFGGGSTTLLDDLDEFATELGNMNVKAAFKALLNRPNQKGWKWVQSYHDEMTLLKTWALGMKASRRIEEEKQFQPTLQRLEAELAVEHVEEKEIFSPASQVSKTLARVASARIMREIAITGCALQRYKLVNGEYPDELSRLIPKFLNEIPVDPVDGKPLRYKKQYQSFVLYSVGTDGIDDGGDPTLKNSDRAPNPSLARDWVWPLPATEEQIVEWEQQHTK